MIHSTRFTAVLDTNVIYPIDIRDLLFWFAHEDLFTVKWSKHIFDEWEELMRRKGCTEDQLRKRLEMANKAFPDALVQNYESLISGCALKDEKDNHVLAAAIKTNANVIVTNNIKDFPERYLANCGLIAKLADDFLVDTIDLNTNQAVIAFRKLVLNRRNPDLDEYQILEIFRNRGLKQTADYLHSLI